MAAYSSRQSSITDGNVAYASLFNNEFNQLILAFATSTGHMHNGGAGEGGYVSLIADSDKKNYITTNQTDNTLDFFVEVGGTAVNQINVQDGVIIPITTNDIDLGSATKQFKDAFFDGVVTTDGLALPTTSVTDILDEDAMGSDSATALATQQSIKAYVDAQVTTSALSF